MSTTQQFRTTCCYCGVGCGVIAHKHANDKITVEGDPTHPSNKGMLCSKGMNLHYTVMDKSDRILYPSMRSNRSMPHQRVTWDEALDRTAAVFKTLIQKYGPDSVGFYVSGQCLTEEYYIINKLIKGFIGSNNIDTNSRLCMSSAVVGYKLSLGEDSVPVCYDDIELCDTLLVAGANPAWNHPIIWRRVEAHKAANPSVKIIVVDPRRTQTAEMADLHLAIRPGTDVTLMNALARCLFELGAVNFEFVNKNVEGVEAIKVKIFERTIEEAASICDVPAEDIRTAAQWISESEAFLSMWTMGFNQSVIGVNKNLSLINLHLLTGQIGKPGSGPFSLTGQPNAMGGREVGGLANMLPAHRDLANEAHRNEVQAFWGGTTISPKVGLSATEMFAALETGQLKAIWIICTNPMVSMPDANAVENALKKAKFVVVQDVSNRSDTVKFADIVLPAAAWSEKEGTMTNAERRITYLPKFTEPVGEALADTNIICRFAHKMGFEKHFDYFKKGDKNNKFELNTDLSRSLAEGVFLEHAALTKGTNIDITGLNYSILKEKRSVQWPFPADNSLESELGTKRLFKDNQFFTPTKKARLHACADENASEPISKEFPLVLTTGRIRDQWHTMTKTGRVKKLNQHIPEPFLEIHPDDALCRGLIDGQLSVIKGHRGEVKVKVKITEDVRQGLVFLPMHWGKILGKNFGRTNNLTNSLYDPRSKEPDFKFSAVEVACFKKPKENIIIIGAGASAWSFIQMYRTLNQEDTIQVFSKEPFSFYNRIMLPDYVSETQTWQELKVLTDTDLFKLNVTTFNNNGIEKIDLQAKIVTDAQGVKHPYDKLIMGTGSRAIMPPNVPILNGISNMRTRLDADILMAKVKDLKTKPNEIPTALISGGGLLGLEMAGSLHHLGFKIVIVNRSSRFMDRQLDTLGSQLLLEEMRDLGIETYFNDEIDTFYGSEQVEAVRLKSGRKIDCQVVIFAIGTRPNMELAQDAGLVCQRGVVVNSYLQTSDPSVFALGEIAEYEREIWGISAAAEEQAKICARYISGDEGSFYTGSTFMNILKVEGLQIASIGIVEIPTTNAHEYEEILFIDKAKRFYKKCIIHNDKLVGTILIGDKSEFQEFKELITKGIELSEKRLALLRSGKTAEPMLGKLVCSCNTIGSGNIEKAIEGGCDNLEAVCQKTSAGTGCGSCRPEIKRILETLDIRLLDVRC
jgi:ferredoxin-nitrate reductase